MTLDYTAKELPAIAKQLIQEIATPIWLFYGEMGSGKTTLIREILLQLGVEDHIQSPTYSLVNEYCDSKNQVVYHFDFYRIETEEEAYDMGVEDYFDSGNRCFIEWPEKISNLLPEKSVKIHIIVTGLQTRRLTIKK